MQRPLSLILFATVLSVAATCVYGQAGPESGQEPGPPPGSVPVTGIAWPVVTHHTGEFNGLKLSYTATVGAIDINDSEDKPGARIVSTAYVVDAAAASPVRPVMFVWNGGPISPSVFLHMGAFGPKRLALPDDLDADPAGSPLVDNPYCILDVTDLVYFDPAGTGFSRALPDKPLEDYFGIVADGQQTAAFIAAWLKENGRLGSPVYLFGESYGTNRAVETAGQLANLTEPVLVDGVVLFGQAVNIIEYAQRPLNIISYVVSLPTLAAIGWYHGKAEAGGASLEDFVNSAWDYAQDDYLDALFQGNALSVERLNEIAAQLQRFSGLRSEVFVENRLRVSKELYRVELFREEGLVLGRSDARYLGSTESKDAGKDQEPPDPAAALPGLLAQAFKSYLVADLGVPSAEQYVISSPVKGLDGWDWNGKSPFARFDYGASLTPLFEKHPEARVLVSAGYYDTMTTTGASQYLVTQESWPAGQVSLKFYPGGHMAYSISASARDMAADLRTLIAAGQ